MSISIELNSGYKNCQFATNVCECTVVSFGEAGDPFSVGGKAGDDYTSRENFKLPFDRLTNKSLTALINIAIHIHIWILHPCSKETLNNDLRFTGGFGAPWFRTPIQFDSIGSDSIGSDSIRSDLIRFDSSDVRRFSFIFNDFQKFSSIIIDFSMRF